MLDVCGLQHGKAHYKLVNKNRDLISSYNVHCHSDLISSEAPAANQALTFSIRDRVMPGSTTPLPGLCGELLHLHR